MFTLSNNCCLGSSSQKFGQIFAFPLVKGMDGSEWEGKYVQETATHSNPDVIINAWTLSPSRATSDNYIWFKYVMFSFSKRSVWNFCRKVEHSDRIFTSFTLNAYRSDVWRLYMVKESECCPCFLHTFILLFFQKETRMDSV